MTIKGTMTDIIEIDKLKFRKYIDEIEIMMKISEISKIMNHELENSNPLFIVILKGSFIFASDLIRFFNHPCQVSFLQLSSYEGTQSTGIVKGLENFSEDIKDRTIVLVEDIIDTGQTMTELLKCISKLGPKEVKVVSLLVKLNKMDHSIKVDYKCFDIDDEFVVGYGLDYNQQGRNLKDIYKIYDDSIS